MESERKMGKKANIWRENTISIVSKGTRWINIIDEKWMTAKKTADITQLQRRSLDLN